MASKHVCVLGVLPYEMYTRVNLSGVNGFLNVRESQGMIKERSVIHVLMITTEHAAVLTSLRSLQLVCVRVCVCAGGFPLVHVSRSARARRPRSRLLLFLPFVSRPSSSSSR